LALTFGREKNLISEKAAEAQDVSLNWSKDFVTSNKGDFVLENQKWRFGV